MRIPKLLFLTLLVTLSISLPAFGAGSHHGGATTADSVTAVSDTTDSDDESLDTAATTTTIDLDDANDDASSLFDLTNIRHHSRWIQNLFDWAALGVGGLAIVFVLLLLLSPILAIILIIWLIARSGRRSPPIARPTETAQDGKHNTQIHASIAQEAGKTFRQRPYTVRQSIDDKKDRATLHIALGIGIIIFFIIIYSRTFIAIGALLTCYGVGEYINARREERRNDEQND